MVSFLIDNRHYRKFDFDKVKQVFLTALLSLKFFNKKHHVVLKALIAMYFNVLCSIKSQSLAILAYRLVELMYVSF